MGCEGRREQRAAASDDCAWADLSLGDSRRVGHPEGGSLGVLHAALACLPQHLSPYRAATP